MTGDPFIGADHEEHQHDASHRSTVAHDWTVDPWDAPDVVGEFDVEPEIELPSRWRRPLRIAGLCLVSGILLFGAVGLWMVHQLNPGGTAAAAVNFTVNEGDTLSSIAARLEQEKYIVNATVFRWYVSRNGGITVLPGYYAIKPRDTAGNIMRILNTPPAQTFSKVTFPEGLTVAQMATRLQSKVAYMKSDQFLSAATDGSVKSEFLPAGATSLEGLLFPDTYQVSGDDTERRVLQRMVALMERVGRQEKVDEARQRTGFSPYQILIIASIIEREAKVPEDRAKISRVIYNRLAMKMPLEIDATLLYGQPEGSSVNALIKIDSPYNSYKRRGLPPTPIANPGRASIQAAMAPAPNPLATDPVCQGLPSGTTCQYLYYVLSDADGHHVFAVTYAQHLVNVAKARQAGLLN